MSYVIPAVFGLFALSLFWWRRRNLYILSWQIGGPTSYPFVGNLLSFYDSERKLYKYINLI